MAEPRSSKEMIFPSREFLRREVGEAVNTFYAPFREIFDSLRCFVHRPTAEANELAGPPALAPDVSLLGRASAAAPSNVSKTGWMPVAKTKDKKPPIVDFPFWNPSGQDHTDAAHRLPFLDWEVPPVQREVMIDLRKGAMRFSVISDNNEIILWVRFGTDPLETSKRPVYSIERKGSKLTEP